MGDNEPRIPTRPTLPAKYLMHEVGGGIKPVADYVDRGDSYLVTLTGGGKIGYPKDMVQSFELIETGEQSAGGGPGGASGVQPVVDHLPCEGTVAAVIDGDTVRLASGHTIRLIGVDTPETVHPAKPVEHFGREASEFTRRHLTGEEVWLVYDGANVLGDHRDRFGRLLAYVHRTRDGLDFNAELVRQGYAHAYTKYPLALVEEFREYERQAQSTPRGLWGSRPSDGKAVGTDAEPVVYVKGTRGSYHREGCRELGDSPIPLKLSEARRHYSPCRACDPLR